MSNILKFVLIGVVFLILPNLALAHNSVFTAKRFDRDMVMMITYNVDHPHAGEPTTFNIRLYKDTDGTFIAYKQLNFSMKRGKDKVFDKDYQVADPNELNVVYTFPQPGDYTLALKFQDPAGGVISEGEFPLSAQKKLNGSVEFFTLQSLIIFLTGLGVGLLGNRFKSIDIHP